MCLLGGGSMTRRMKNNALLNQSHNKWLRMTTMRRRTIGHASGILIRT